MTRAVIHRESNRVPTAHPSLSWLHQRSRLLQFDILQRYRWEQIHWRADMLTTLIHFGVHR